MAINEWWKDVPEERYWLETTGRHNIGANLLAPQHDDAGAENASYLLVTYVRDGDIVLHYDTNRRALVGWSRAAGGFWESEIVWASHAGSPKEATREAAWEHGVEGPFWFSQPITLEQLRTAEPAITAVHAQLQETHRRPLYFPFAISSRRPLRPTQFYMTKWPIALLDAIPGLKGQVGSMRAKAPEESPASSELGLPFAEVDEETEVAPPDPFTVDPAVVERGIAGHARTLNALARAVTALGHAPLRNGPNDPAFDLAWVGPTCLFVSEVKSISDTNEERQLRLGLGQVLRYRHLMARSGKQVVAVLAAERRPRAKGWEELCKELGVTLVWPEVMKSRL